MITLKESNGGKLEAISDCPVCNGKLIVRQAPDYLSVTCQTDRHPGQPGLIWERTLKRGADTGILYQIIE